MDFTQIISNLQEYVIQLGGRKPYEIMLKLFLDGGWIIFALAMIWGLFEVYMNYIKDKYAAKIKWALLAIDIPKENLQSTKAVEHIFAAMWPFLESINLIEKYIDGEFQLAFSLEIVSIGGYTQFLIRVPVTHKDIVEAAIYGQYPKAEITEVEDYVLRYKDLRFPSDDYDLWGTEFGLTKRSPYPIRTYPSFEHTLTQTFADPIASFLEVFSKINKDEELWLQLVITPIKDDWKEEGYKIINKLIGVKAEKKKGIFDLFLSPFNYLATLTEELFVYGIGYEPGKVEGLKKDEFQGPPNKMLYLTPEERNAVVGITTKISKLGYQTKMRAIFVTQKGKMNKPKGAAALIGALQQFSALDLNAFKPIMKTFTKANYFFVERRVIAKQNRILRNYKSRSQTYGWGKGFVLNIEELATIFHFPVPEAVRENVKRVEAKKEAAPVNLPDTIYEEDQVMKQMALDEQTAETAPARQSESAKAEPPGNLPI